MPNTNNEDVSKLAGTIQQECHDFIEMMMKYGKKNRKKWTRDDLLQVFMYTKLADIENRLQELERRTTVSKN